VRFYRRDKVIAEREKKYEGKVYEAKRSFVLREIAHMNIRKVLYRQNSIRKLLPGHTGGQREWVPYYTA
jgi:hypothetical protein